MHNNTHIYLHGINLQFSDNDTEFTQMYIYAKAFVALYN